MFVQGTLKVSRVTGVTHEVNVKDRFGNTYEFRRLYQQFAPGRYWELHDSQRGWEGYGNPLVETLLDHMVKE